MYTQLYLHNQSYIYIYINIYVYIIIYTYIIFMCSTFVSSDQLVQYHVNISKLLNNT